MIALGWISGATDLPAGLTLIRKGHVHVICARPTAAQTNRDRLASQVRCFDSGIDFVPVAPTETIFAQDAPAPMGLPAMLKELAGKGQLTITCELANPPSPSRTSGKHWLTARKAQYDGIAQQDAILQRLMAQLHRTPIRHAAGASTCDILIDRRDCMVTKDDIATQLEKDPLAQHCIVNVTGLWPAYGFVQPLQNANNAA